MSSYKTIRMAPIIDLKSKILYDLPWRKSENDYLDTEIMNIETENIERQIAKEYMLQTGRHLFLTGKAGSGKTTLLKDIIDSTDKNVVVVAPTGVAAINAGGVTIHSLLTLPLTAFVPDDNYPESQFITSRTMLKRHMKYNKEKLNLLREMDTLVIDEVSMVRADMMDAIDFVLRSVRRRADPFGGVQVIMIGDLYQLPPVIKDYAWDVLKHYYRTGYFFSSHVFQRCNVLCVELTKVYRQKDNVFLDTLNRIRDGIATEEDLKLLNQQYAPKELEDEEIITLCTHNAIADQINQKKLAEIEEPIIKLKAKITGKFNENAYPVDEEIKLKIGAIIMFTRNESEGLYYNGKIAKVLNYDREEDLIRVEFIGDKSTSWIEKVEWKNEKYTINAENTIESEVLGEFIQFPVRLAWAVTVHKSQGLTLNKVRMDLSKSFAAGQAYVALSRCTSLEGLTLIKPVTARNVIVDPRIVEFHNAMPDLSHAMTALPEAKKAYSLESIRKVFSMSKLVDRVEEIQDYISDSSVPHKDRVYIIVDKIKKQLLNLLAVSTDFDGYLSRWIREMGANEAYIELIYTKTSKGINYFTEQIYEKALKPLSIHIPEYQVKAKTKKYIKLQTEFYDQLWDKMDRLYSLTIGDDNLGKDAKIYKRSELEMDSQPIISSSKKGATNDITLQLYRDGLTVKAISEIRSMAASTIDTHLAHWIKEGEIPITDLMKEEKVAKMMESFDTIKFEGFGDLRVKMGYDVSYGELNQIKAHRAWLEAKD